MKAPRCEHAPAGACDVPGCPFYAQGNAPAATPITVCVVCGDPASFKAANGWHCMRETCRRHADKDTALQVAAHVDEARGLRPDPSAGRIGGARGLVGSAPEDGYGDGSTIPMPGEPWWWAPRQRQAVMCKGAVFPSQSEARHLLRGISEEAAQRRYFELVAADVNPIHVFSPSKVAREKGRRGKR